MHLQQRFSPSRMARTVSLLTVVGVLSVAAAADAAPKVAVRLPERFRVLTEQLFDLRVEASELASTTATLRVWIDGVDFTAALGSPEITTGNDDDAASLDKAWTFRRVRFRHDGVKTVVAVVRDASGTESFTARIGVQRFETAFGLGDRQAKSLILYIGDAMGTSYRDAARIVAQSTDHRFREGFFDELLQMDQLPVSGMALTYAMNSVVPDSANTATAWATGSKTINGALNVFPDNNDFRISASDVQGTKRFALDNPRIETISEYLKRTRGYRTGIVSTADITDATPAGHGGHSITRGLLFDIARQYCDGVFTPGPTFDVILGGGKEKFDARNAGNSGDTRNLIAELVGRGYTSVASRSELNALATGARAPAKLIGLFRTGNMNVAYDKLGLARPADEPAPSFGGFTDQPFLDEMARTAIDVLARDGKPFVLMVEGASIDKQSHPNHATGQIWDTIEFDKAIGAGRDFALTAHQRHGRDTLVVVTADHDQSMHILGVVDMTVAGVRPNVRSDQALLPGQYPGSVGGFPDYNDPDGDRYPDNANRFRIGVGYRSMDHTGSAVPVTAEGPGALLFTGYFDQTDIFFKLARALGGDTRQLDAAMRAVERAATVDPNY